MIFFSIINRYEDSSQATQVRRYFLWADDYFLVNEKYFDISLST